MPINRLVARFAYLFLVCLSLAAESDPSESFDRSRGLPAAEATRLLASELPRAGSLAPWFLLELAERAGSSGDWRASLEWSSKQDLANLPDAIADRVLYRYAEALIATGARDTGLTALRARIESGKAKDPWLWLLWFRETGTDSGKGASAGALAVERVCSLLDAANPVLKASDPAAYALSRYLSGLAAVRSSEGDFAARTLARFTPAYDALYPEYAPWASFYLGWSLYRLGKYPDAVRALSRYLDSFKGHERGWQAATLAALAATESGVDPLPFAERAVTLAATGSDRAESLMLAASVFVDRNELARAETVYASIADGSATSGITALAPRALFALADLALRAGRPNDAEARWLAISERFPKDPLAGEGLYRAGERRFIAGEWARAAELFARYRREWPEGPYLDSVLALGGEAYRKLGNQDLAILWWEELLAKIPASSSAPRAWRNLVDAYRAEGDYETALRAAESYRRAFPAEARLDGMGDAVTALRRLASGENAGVASLVAAWEREGKARTVGGRAAGLALAREYLADYRTRSDAKAVLQSIVDRAPAAPDNLGRDDRAAFASAFALLGSLHREDGLFKDASRALLRAGSYFAAIDGERAAEALYGATDSFFQSGLEGDARKTIETLERSWPSSAWTRRAEQLLRPSRPE